jgi:hypothetical protein
MHEITGRRLGAVVVGKCPDCGGVHWQPGPKGGASQNFECVGCKSRFNIVIVGHTVLLAHRIDYNGDWAPYRHSYPIGPLIPRAN